MGLGTKIWVLGVLMAMVVPLVIGPFDGQSQEIIHIKVYTCIYIYMFISSIYIYIHRPVAIGMKKYMNTQIIITMFFCSYHYTKQAC